ncbi:Uncharacterized protein DAT39_017989 [Clarias magur]|uniref:Uncharacterized protein n=1 Tax=Clarias magur TaxID=1594786 RepID=A0A8J4WTD0_CLAMG|nr:Uncharacterized protein DAT39_023569 [Clarias magur]KAF5892289.1 Uncharacterized protein DAT39_017989 [Clarias magur]
MFVLQLRDVAAAAAAQCMQSCRSRSRTLTMSTANMGMEEKKDMAVTSTAAWLPV